MVIDVPSIAIVRSRGKLGKVEREEREREGETKEESKRDRKGDRESQTREKEDERSGSYHHNPLHILHSPLVFFLLFYAFCLKSCVFVFLACLVLHF